MPALPSAAAPSAELAAAVQKSALLGRPGFLVRSGKDSDARFIGKELELAVSWQATPNVNFTGSLSAFQPGEFIRETGPARTIKMIGFQTTFRF